MQDVFRKIYEKKHLQIQKQKKNRELNLPQPNKKGRLYKGIWQDYRPLVQKFQLQQQLRKKKQLQYGNDFIKQRQKFRVYSVSSTSQSLKLPSIHRSRENNSQNMNSSRQESQYSVNGETYQNNPKRLKMRQKQQETRQRSIKLRKIFRLRTFQIIFINDLLKMRKVSLINKRKLTQQYSQDLVQIIQNMVNQYYVNILEEQLLKYLQLIKIKIQQPKIMLQKQVISMVYFMSKELAKSSVSRELMEFIILISDNGSFFPTDYLTLFQAERVQISNKYGCSQNVSPQICQMLIAVFVGLKIFCLCILYRPWTIIMPKSPISPKQIIDKFHIVHKLIHGTASIFYFIIMDLFCFPLNKNPNVKQNVWKKFKIQPKSFLNIYPADLQVKINLKQDEIFPNQNRKLYETLQKENLSTFADIKENIQIWLQRIYCAFVRQKENKLSQKRNQIKKQQLKIMKTLLRKTNLSEKSQTESNMHQN